MPTYEYRCSDCAHEFERFQRMSDAPVDKCPECGGVPERLLSAGAGLLFKGDGFYITENRSESYKKKAEKEGGSPSSAADSGKTGGGDAPSGDSKGKAAGASEASGAGGKRSGKADGGTDSTRPSGSSGPGGSSKKGTDD